MTATEFFKEIDKLVEETLALSPIKNCCRRGCSHCCSEPLYADDLEVDDMLQHLSEEQRVRITERTRTWVEKAKPFLSKSTRQDGLIDAFEYRDANIPCPLLENNLCMVYERRPYGCRTFFAMGNPDNCKMPNRREQLIASFDFSHPRWMGLFGRWAEGKTRIVMDHLGVLLAEKLLGEHHPSSTRRDINLTDL